MPTARETSKTQTLQNQGPFFPPLLSVGSQASVFKVHWASVKAIFGLKGCFLFSKVILKMLEKIPFKQGLKYPFKVLFLASEVISSLVRLFPPTLACLKRSRKTHQKTKVFSLCETPKILGKERKNAQKSNENRNKKKGNQTKNARIGGSGKNSLNFPPPLKDSLGA